MTEPQAARLIITVTAGVVPGSIEPEHTRRYALTSTQWENAGAEGQGPLLAELNGKAQGYANLLMLQPDRFNFVDTRWLWL